MLHSYRESVIFYVTIVLATTSCGSGATVEPDPYEVDTQKLIGTPFDGLTTGDNFDVNFLCGQYRTVTIDSFPIPVFAALFTAIQEEVIIEGIDMANEAIGFEAYRYTETWSDDARVIYAVEEIDAILNPVGITRSLYQTFNSKQYAERIATDWTIQISYLPAAYIIAHELGHATGIQGHILIDYENDAALELESGSIMQADGGYSSVLTDYNFMMNMQGQIMQEHLGETGEMDSAACPGDEEESEEEEETDDTAEDTDETTETDEGDL